jgi:hypothetical protein
VEWPQASQQVSRELRIRCDVFGDAYTGIAGTTGQLAASCKERVAALAAAPSPHLGQGAGVGLVLLAGQAGSPGGDGAGAGDPQAVERAPVDSLWVKEHKSMRDSTFRACTCSTYHTSEQTAVGVCEAGSAADLVQDPTFMLLGVRVPFFA